jgi:DNA-binding GntR family transcriptional regulator
LSGTSAFLFAAVRQVATPSRRGPSAGRKKMKKLNQQMQENISDLKFSRYWDLNTAFHNTYLNLSSNAPVTKQINIIRRRLFEFGKKDWSRKMREMNYLEHQTMIELFEKGNAIETADYMRDVHCVINY